jgi:hypothetical protein
LPAIVEDYRRFVGRLGEGVAAASDATGPTPAVRRDVALGQTWAQALPEFNRWLDTLGVRPRGRGLADDVSRFLRTESEGDRAFTAAPVVVGLIARDPACEPESLLAEWVRRPPEGSSTIRRLALEVVGLTNRADYLTLLADAVAESGPFAGLAVRAAALMDGGSGVIRKAVRHHPDLPFGLDLIDALTRCPDASPSANIVRALAAGPNPTAVEVALRVMRHRGALPDLEPVVRAAEENQALSDELRRTAQDVLTEMRSHEPIAGVNPPSGKSGGKNNPNGTGGRIQ